MRSTYCLTYTSPVISSIIKGVLDNCANKLLLMQEIKKRIDFGFQRYDSYEVHSKTSTGEGLIAKYCTLQAIKNGCLSFQAKRMVENIGYPEYIMDNKLVDDQYKDVSFIICSNCQHDFIIRQKVPF